MKIIEKPLKQVLKQINNDYKGSFNEDQKVEENVKKILKEVSQKGDRAIKIYEKEFDQIKLDDFKVSKDEINKAYKKTSSQLKEALEAAKKNITSFHKLELEKNFIDSKKKGVFRGEKITPLASVGIYVPGGTAAYPSSLLMNAIPAKVAGVKKIVMVTPPQKNGLNKTVLAAAKVVGIDQIYTVGGAQAIGALAYGTQSIPKVDKITGPGNIFVAKAKRQVYGQVGIDMIAGPSEICIIANIQSDPKQVAADLLSQAEHDKRARPILITDSKKLVKKVQLELKQQVKFLPRREIAEGSLNNKGMIIKVENIDQAFIVANKIAPEHLEVQLPEAASYLNQIKNAGSVFLGFSASEPVGDYLAGPNHILPTGGTALFSSPLGVYDFVKRTQFISYTRKALSKEKNAITQLARAEGLEAHARAIESRFKK